ncbi:hypothetical protein Tco_0136746 [Tanacetum coccineum]
MFPSPSELSAKVSNKYGKLVGADGKPLKLRPYPQIDVANDQLVTTESNVNESGLDPSLSDEETITHEASILAQANSIYANKNGGGKVGNEPVNEFPSSYATKLIPTSSTKANLRKLKANVPKDADYDV